MAEFQEVMKQAKKMCLAHACSNCSIRSMDGECRMDFTNIGMLSNPKEVEAIERIVMDWAAANPEPRYPTWSEWQISNFQMAERAICAAHFMDAGDAGCCTSGNNCDKCRERPIPADIAEKLGIKPIGGKDNAE